MSRRHHPRWPLGRKACLLASFERGLVLLGLLFAATAHAATPLEELYSNDELRASVSIDTAGDLYQRAAFVLAVEIATPRWFSRGTRVDEFRIPGAVVRPISNFADNSSRRIAGDTWSVQRWRFRVFPREVGELIIEPLRVFVSVNSEAGVVEGSLELDAPRVQIASPPGTAAQVSQVWIATPSLQIEQSWDGTLDSYLPGDAITRRRHFAVEDTPAMMLESSALEAIEGLSFYQAPPSVNDKTDRGQLTGIRDETLVVTFEAPGNYKIPGLEYLWFNTTKQRFETLSLPSLEVMVTSADPSPSKAKNRRELLLPWPLLLAAGGTVVLGFLLWLSRNSRLSKQFVGIFSSRFQQYRLKQAYLSALRQKDSAACVQLLYARLTKTRDLRHLDKAVCSLQDKTSLRQLLEHAYGSGSELPEQKPAVFLWNTVGDGSGARTKPPGLILNPNESAVKA